jgi:hypothetical protein
MEAIKVKGVAKNGELTIPVLKSFNEHELEVIVLSSSGTQNIKKSLHEREDIPPHEHRWNCKTS